MKTPQLAPVNARLEHAPSSLRHRPTREQYLHRRIAVAAGAVLFALGGIVGGVAASGGSAPKPRVVHKAPKPVLEAKRAEIVFNQGAASQGDWGAADVLAAAAGQPGNTGEEQEIDQQLVNVEENRDQFGSKGPSEASVYIPKPVIPGYPEAKEVIKNFVVEVDQAHANTSVMQGTGETVYLSPAPASKPTQTEAKHAA